MKIIVTGGNSFVGINLIKLLVYKGCNVTAFLGMKSLIPESNFSKQVTWINIDLSKEILINKNYSVIIHVAGRSPQEKVTDFDIIRDNVISTYNIINWAKKITPEKIIFLSSISVYGEIKSSIVDETTSIINPSSYGISKLMCEQLLKDIESFIPSISLRLPGIIGFNSKRNWLSVTSQKLKNLENIEIYNPKHLFNNVIHVDDLSNFCYQIINKKITNADCITLGASKSISIAEIVEMLKNSFNKSSSISFESNSKKSFLISSEKAINVYGYMPKTVIEILVKFIKENKIIENYDL